MAPFLPVRRWLGALPLALPFLGTMLAGIAIRYVVARRRGRARAYLRIIRSPRWITDSVRLIVFCGLLGFTYGCVQLLIPLGHPPLLDQDLRNLHARLL